MYTCNMARWFQLIWGTNLGESFVEPTVPNRVIHETWQHLFFFHTWERQVVPSWSSQKLGRNVKSGTVTRGNRRLVTVTCFFFEGTGWPGVVFAPWTLNHKIWWVWKGYLFEILYLLEYLIETIHWLILLRRHIGPIVTFSSNPMGFVSGDWIPTLTGGSTSHLGPKHAQLIFGVCIYYTSLRIVGSQK